MYYVVLMDKAIGPFLERVTAYNYATEILSLKVGEYAVKSDLACQQMYSYLPIVKPRLMKANQAFKFDM